MKKDNETWLIDEGNRIILKKSSAGFDSLSSLEKAIYHLWVVDYAVRNSGTLAPMLELNEDSISQLSSFAQNNSCRHLYMMMELAKDEKDFCNNYYRNFDDACEDLRHFDKNRK